MSFSRQTQQNIQELLNQGLTIKAKPVDFTMFPSFTQRKIPDDIEFDRSEGDFLTISGKQHALYLRCLESLSDEHELESMSKQEIDTALWHLVCEIYIRPDELKKSNDIKKKAISFEERFLMTVKPIREYEVLIPIEGLHIGSKPIKIGDVKFIQMTSETLAEWHFEKVSTTLKDAMYDTVINHGAAIIPEKGNDPTKAIERARAKLLTTLNLFRTALLFDHEPSVINFRIHDEEMLFKLGEHAALREIEDSKVVSLNWKRSFRRVDLKLDGLIETQTTKSLELLDDVAKAVSETGKGIQVRFVRAIEWIGSSVERDKTDDKVVDLCTALETLLTTQDDPRKGELIALRTMLISQMVKESFFDPAKMLALYEKRSNIIHGSKFNICTDSEYVFLRSITLQVLQNAIKFVKLNNITKYSDFISSLHKDSKLVDKSLEWWKPHTEYYKNVRKATEDYYNRAASTSHALNLLNLGILFFGLFAFFRMTHYNGVFIYYTWVFFTLSVTMTVTILFQMFSQIKITWVKGILEFKEALRQLLEQRRVRSWTLKDFTKDLKTLKNKEFGRYCLRMLLQAMAIFGAFIAFIVSWIGGMPDLFVFGLGLTWFVFIIMGLTKHTQFKVLIPIVVLFIVLGSTLATLSPWYLLAVAFYGAAFFISKFIQQPYEYP